MLGFLFLVYLFSLGEDYGRDVIVYLFVKIFSSIYFVFFYVVDGSLYFLVEFWSFLG